MYQRLQVEIIYQRMLEADNPLIQAITGPRQSGKSTMISQALGTVGIPFLSVSADDVTAPNIDWIRTEWQQARNLQKRSGGTFILV
ncbi:MAG: ATP-binding protein, partial [Coriobacteriales bacterium]